jgi:hypothetical protein
VRSALRLLAVLVATLVPALALACPVPGHYVATTMGALASGVHVARLSMYAFDGTCDGATGTGTVAERSWSWQGDLGRAYASMGVRIADPTVPDPPGVVAKDRRKPVQGLRQFKQGRSRLAVATGTWDLCADAITITWANGTSETWRATWSDDVAAPRLFKLELTGASTLVGATYLSPAGERDPAAPGAGFAFGGPGPDFMVARPITDAAATAYTGLIRRHNAWCGAATPDEPVAETGLTMPLFSPTTSGVFRHVETDGPYGVFVYVGTPKRNPDVLARRVFLQTSHDWDGDGTIADDLGHTYAGLEILDATGALRGFVFADSSSAIDGCDENNTIASLYYLDAADCDARYGVDAATADEPCRQLLLTRPAASPSPSPSPP